MFLELSDANWSRTGRYREIFGFLERKRTPWQVRSQVGEQLDVNEKMFFRSPYDTILEKVRFLDGLS